MTSSLATPRLSPLDWSRRRRASDRGLSAAGRRAASRLDAWPDWHVVPLPEPTDWFLSNRKPADQAGFLAIGPGGVFAVTVLDHGRSRVLLAGDVVQISGRRPPYIREARRAAKRASNALSAAVKTSVPVVPVLALVGSGPVTYYGLPKDCLVTTYQELDLVLAYRGERITPTTAQKLSVVAQHPETWRTADQYRWYPYGTQAADKTSWRR